MEELPLIFKSRADQEAISSLRAPGSSAIVQVQRETRGEKISALSTRFLLSGICTSVRAICSALETIALGLSFVRSGSGAFVISTWTNFYYPDFARNVPSLYPTCYPESADQSTRTVQRTRRTVRFRVPSDRTSRSFRGGREFLVVRGGHAG